MKRLFSALLISGAIFILSEGIITKLNSVIARTSTINSLYREARNASLKTDNAKKDSNVKVKNNTPIIAVKKENALIIDQKTKDTICNTIMERATEFGGDIFRGFGEVFQAIREIMPPEYDLTGWTPLGIKILAYHLRKSIFLDESKQDRSDLFSFYWGDDIDTGDNSSMSVDTLTLIRQRVTSKSKTAGRPPLNKKKPTKVDSNYRSVTVYTSNGSKFSEDVITCPRVIDNNELGIYYVSKEYNVNFASDSVTNPIAARFVFYQNKTTGRMNLVAVAEEPAQPLILDSEIKVEDLDSEKNIKKDPVSKENMEDLDSEKNIKKDPVSKDNMEEDLDSEKNIKKDPVSKDNMEEDNDSKKNDKKDLDSEDNMEGDLDSEKNMEQDLGSKPNIEEIYFERRKGKEPATFRSQDPICRLDEDELFRTCSQIFNSKYFADKVKFPASYSSVLEHECEKNVVQVRNRKEGDKTVYSEYMASCYMGYNPFGYRPKEEWTFYISRGYNPDTEDKTGTREVFVYKVENGKIFLLNLFSNVGVRMSTEKKSRI